MKTLIATALLCCSSPVEASAISPTYSYEDEKPEKKLEAWPKPENAKTLKTDVQRLRKANTEEMGVQAAEALRAVGAPAVPLLIKALGKEKNEEALERIEGVLLVITEANQTRLLAKELDSKSERVRIWVYRRLAVFPDSALAKDAVARLDKLKKKGDKAEPTELYAAAVFTLSTGEIAGLDVVYSVAKDSWSRHAEEIRIAAQQVRGPIATTALITHLTGGDRSEKVASLRLLASCGDRETAVPVIAPLLDENDNSLRIGAINALRGIIDGDPPLDKLPVFEAIEMAKKWKERVR